MGNEHRNHRDAETMLYRRALLLGAGATALLGASRLLPDWRQLASSSPETSTSSSDPQLTFIPNENSREILESYLNAPLWHKKTVILFGDEVRNGNPLFQTPEAEDAVRSRTENPIFISGLQTARDGSKLPSTEATLRSAKELFLQTASEENQEGTTLVLSAHGLVSNNAPIGILVGSYFDASTGKQKYVTITPDELGAAHAIRFRSMASRLAARELPHITALINCGSGTLASQFTHSLAEMEMAQEPQHLQWAFKPTLPVTFSASTGSENTNVNDWLFEMARHTTIGSLSESAEHMGGNEELSDPGIGVPDPESGELVIVGETEEGPRFA